MAPRNSQDGKGPFKYNDTPPNCDGFNVTAMCRHYDKDCRHGSCWHMDRVRRMVRLWFSYAFDRPGTGDWWERRQEPTEELGSAYAKAKLKGDAMRAKAADALHAALYGHLPCGPKFGGNGIGWSPFPDVDGVGSWGRHVRQWEDREDER